MPKEPPLAGTFAAFTAAAASLERSYLALGTEVWRLRKELERERDLRQRREALATTSALLAHEIRNPLASLELFAGLLAGSCMSEKEHEWVRQIQAGLRILAATVGNILEYHGKNPLQLLPTDICAVLRSTAALLAPVAERAHVQWIADLPEEPLNVLADRHRLEQVFLNLALNVFRYASQGGILKVTATRSDDSALVTFEDHGPGIPAELLPRVFDAGVTTRAGGIGLGLALVRDILQRHGANIHASSVPGEGSCFELRFPFENRKEREGD